MTGCRAVLDASRALVLVALGARLGIVGCTLVLVGPRLGGVVSPAVAVGVAGNVLAVRLALRVFARTGGLLVVAGWAAAVALLSRRSPHGTVVLPGGALSAPVYAYVLAGVVAGAAAALWPARRRGRASTRPAEVAP